MSYEYMEKIMAWSEKECPNEICSRTPKSMEEQTMVTEHPSSARVRFDWLHIVYAVNFPLHWFFLAKLTLFVHGQY